ncbi:lipopolysaccharide biosynthesis protein [Bradyrhizobium sp. LHD-71]|uniref:lipopolysaccharide biosynthesis protein n=1 Tax=Bradyrhizobium sp. LHD-71 TaxID=3072141 RepID=UPI00280EA888|nr:lipopolysaccharide biosynthesis protein [Bradyrhizobium sp. LHD-71]MDQ8726750.1 lipopolysaccharide biosynthesis protein [Bradyrhizobium sp. LHD-71]
MDQTSLADRAIASVLWLLVGRWGQLALGLVTLTVMARYVGPEVYGLFALCYVVIGLSHALGGAFAEALIQRRTLDRHHEDAVLAMSLVPAVMLAAVMVFGAKPLADLFGAAELVMVFPVMSVVVVLQALGAVPAALLQRDMRHRKLVAIDNGAGLIGSLTGIGLAIAGFGIWSLVASETIRAFTRTCASMRVARWVPRLATSRSAIVDIWPFGRKVVAIRLLQYVDRMTPRVVLGLVLGEAAVGYYALGWRIYEQIQNALVTPMASVAMPVAARAQDDMPTLRAILKGATTATSSIAYPAFIGAAAIAPVAIPFLLGNRWGPAVPVVQVLLLIGIRSAISAFNGGVLRGLGRPDLQLGMLAIGATATLVMVPIAAPYGVAAVGGAILARSFLTWPIGAAHIQRLTGLPLRTQARLGLEALIAASVMGAFILTLQQLFAWTPWVMIAISLSAGPLVYLGCFAALAPVTASAAFRASKAFAAGDRPRAKTILRELSRSRL